MKNFLHFKYTDNKGVTAVLVAIMIVTLLGFASLAVDIGYGYLSKNELQDAADAAALAAASRLGAIYEPMTYQAQLAYDATGDAEIIIGAAQDVAEQNKAAQKSISIQEGEVVIGTWDPALSPSFAATYSHPNAVRVTARRDGNANGPISTFFAQIFGVTSMDVSAVATAALTGESTAGPGGLPLPVGISCAWVNNHSCGDVITFYPTTTSCAGWNTYTSTPANANKLRNILNTGVPNLTTCALKGFDDPGCYHSPETTAGETEYVFTGGTVASAFPEMEMLFNAMRVLNDGVLDNDTNPDTWTTAVPVFANADGSCVCNEGGSNPSGDKLIVGFVTIVMTEVVGVSSKELHGQLICENVEPGRGGGSPWGTMGSIPGLVQ